MGKLKTMEVIMDGEKQLRVVDYSHYEQVWGVGKVHFFDVPALNEGEVAARTMCGKCYVFKEFSDE